ncbi:hexameric tyrosine-coordinated heme protein [Aerococcaceae bacterium WGS1372]
MNQPAPKVRELLRATNATNADSISFASQVLTIQFQTVVAANHYWDE